MCIDCHSKQPHDRDRLNSHTSTVACQTCHIPRMAIDTPTKMVWDWSTAGQDLPQDPHHYLKGKGSFQYAQNVRPEYRWYDGRAYRYLTGDKIDDPTVCHPCTPVDACLNTCGTCELCLGKTTLPPECNAMQDCTAGAARCDVRRGRCPARFPGRAGRPAPGWRDWWL